MVIAECYEDVQRLETPVVQELLDRGSPPQRVWAVWTLALRAAGAAGPRGLAELAELTRHLEREPDPGVRRTLAVILAAHRQYDLLVALTRTDPEPLVRASAIQVVTRVAAGGAIPESVVRDAAGVDAAMRIAILGAIGEGSPRFLVDIAVEALGDREVSVRLEALEALVRAGDDHTLTRDRAAAFLAGLSDVEMFLDAAGRWIRIAGPESCAQAVVGCAVQLRGALLRQQRELTWSVAEPLIGTDGQLLAYALSRSDLSIPTAALVGGILRGMHRGFVERLTTRLAGAARARHFLATLRLAMDDAPDAYACDGLLRQARGLALALEIREAGEVLGELAAAHPVELVLGLEHAVESWTATGAPADLWPTLVELRAYCAARLGDALPPAPGPPDVPQLALGVGASDPRPHTWDGRTHFKFLVKTLDDLLG